MKNLSLTGYLFNMLSLNKIKEVQLLQREYNNIWIKIQQLLNKYMNTKDKIVERLLEEKNITAAEAIILLKERTPIGFQQFPANPINPFVGGKVPYHTICGCDVCHCIMGNKMVDPNNSGNYSIDFTYTTSESGKCKNGPTCFCSGECKK